jgi:hypothetical protein
MGAATNWETIRHTPMLLDRRDFVSHEQVAEARALPGAAKQDPQTQNNKIPFNSRVHWRIASTAMDQRGRCDPADAEFRHPVEENDH